MDEDTIDSFRGEYRFLSNFFELDNPVVDDERIYYPTVEHAYQAQKTRDKHERLYIRSSKDATEAKKRGFEVAIRMEWEVVKDAIMLQFLLQKFLYNPNLRNRLLATGSKQLIEGNHWGDKYWGVCNGVGQNKLGKYLMQTRELFRQ